MLDTLVREEIGEHGITFAVVPIYCLWQNKLEEFRYPAFHRDMLLACPYCGKSDQENWSDYHVVNPGKILLERLNFLSCVAVELGVAK